MHLQFAVLLLSRICAKRKFKIRGRVKWLSLIDILFAQNVYDPIYWAAWVLWCFWWDVYDRKWCATAGGMGGIIVALRSLWVIQTNTFMYIPAVLSSMVMTYCGFYEALFV